MVVSSREYDMTMIECLENDVFSGERMNSIKELEELTVEGCPSGIEAEEEEIIHDPFNPEEIFIKTKEVPMDTVIRRIRKGTINLAPAFQRNSVWGKKQKSRLIESLMLKIPLPMFYVAGDKQEKWDVVDGLQRLTTICEFLFGSSKYEEIIKLKELDYSHGFKLEGLEFWGDKYNNKRFDDLPDILQTRILESAFTFTIIEAGTPEVVRRNIFKRINTGGMPLTPQEIRHALYQGESTILLEQLSTNKYFIRAVSSSIDDSRMGAREMILRMLSFVMRSYKEYPNNNDMDSFICDTMIAVNKSPDNLKNSGIKNIRIENVKNICLQFERGMQRAHDLFGEYAFRRSVPGCRKTPVNKSLFEVWGTILARMKSSTFDELINDKQNFMKNYESYISDHKVELALSRNSWMKSSVELRFQRAYELIEDYRSN